MASTATIQEMKVSKPTTSRSSSGSGDWGVAPKKLTFPSLSISPSKTSLEKKEAMEKHASKVKEASDSEGSAKQANGAKGSPSNSSRKSSSGSSTGNKKPGPKITVPKATFDERWAEQMSPSEKLELLTKAGNLVTVRGLPGFGFEVEANAEKPKRGGNASPLALAFKDAPQHLLLAYFGLARKLLRGPKRTWNVLNEHALNVNWLIGWAISDAKSPTSIDVDVSACNNEDIITLWAAAMTMQGKRAKKSIERQFQDDFLPNLSLEETLEAWHLARHYGVYQAERDLKYRLHAFAWAKLTTRSSLPFVDVENLFNSAPGESFTIAAMTKLAWSMIRRNPERDSQFHAMSKEFQDAWMVIYRECKLQADLKNAAMSAGHQQRARANFKNTSPRGYVPHKPQQAIAVIGHNPYN